MRHGDPALNEYFDVTCQNCATVLLTVRRIPTKPQPSANMTPPRKLAPKGASGPVAASIRDVREAIAKHTRSSAKHRSAGVVLGNAGTWFHSMNEPGSGQVGNKVRRRDRIS